MSTTLAAMMFLMGLTASLHCAGMCGPIMLVMPFQQLGGVRRYAGILLYHFGRVSVYALIGLILYSFKILFPVQIQQYIAIATGVMLFLAGILTLLPLRALRFTLPWSGFITQQLGRFMGSPSLGALWLTGVFNGFLPCGMVYMAISAMVSTAGSGPEAVTMMYSFGAGTAPLLIGLTVLKDKLAFLRNGSFKKLVPFAMILFGCFFILRGLDLGVPFMLPHTADPGTTTVSCRPLP
ncbi:MAG: sulfite exporter TauE/SafE family protein [Sphingobacteriales bacterium]|nr:MAG: sulfite exporter TauE/SafE family protein [Sphingobacteriales bacterium]